MVDKRDFIKKIAIWICVCFFTLILSLETIVVLKSNDYFPSDSYAAVILGYAIDQNGYPDEILQERLEKGLILYNLGFCEKIVVSGGKGPGDKIPVAEAMKTWLLENDVDDGDIIVEGNSANTLENILYTKQIIGEQSVIIVTSDFHIYRALATARMAFENATGAAAVSELSLKTALLYIKEPFSIIKLFFEKGVLLDNSAEGVVDIDSIEIEAQ